jgi:plasmid maintenance system killer protein
MTIEREQIYQFIDTIYCENKTIVLTAPTGFGKLQCFLIPILKDLMESPKKCLIVSYTKVILENIQEQFFKNIERLSEDRMNIYKIVENRSKTFIHFQNGSIIDYKVYSELRGFSTDEYNIVYVASFTNALRSNAFDLKYLLRGNKKVIVIDDDFNHKQMMRNYPSDNVREMIKDYKPFYSININEPEDIISEIRKLKLRKIHATIRNKSK